MDALYYRKIRISCTNFFKNQKTLKVVFLLFEIRIVTTNNSIDLDY